MRESKLRAGIIGISSGNGHPYSWSAICNGYSPTEMDKCPFPAIPEYLKKQNWPADRLTGMNVTHIWTQDETTSALISQASFIPNIVDHYSELLGQVDVVLLARDDSENHAEMSSIFLKEGIPVFIDKPFATSIDEASRMLGFQKFDHDIYTCSSLRYAKEIFLSPAEYKATGPIAHVKAESPKYWRTYGVHLIEPIVKQFPNRGKLLSVTRQKNRENEVVDVVWENLSSELSLTGNENVPISFTYQGKNSTHTKFFSDSFSCFKEALSEFQRQILSKDIVIDRKETLEVVKILELGSN